MGDDEDEDENSNNRQLNGPWATSLPALHTLSPGGPVSLVGGHVRSRRSRIIFQQRALSWPTFKRFRARPPVVGASKREFALKSLGGARGH